MGNISVRVCDCCGKQLGGRDGAKGITVTAKVVQVGNMKVVLAEGDYCVDCAAQEIGHACPDDPPD